MRLICLSDTHCQLEKIQVPQGDILIHAGDFTYRGDSAEIEKELDQLQRIGKPFKAILMIAGNHDWLAEKQPALMRKMCADRGLVYLCDEPFTALGKKFYGSPWQPEFCDWAFNLPRGTPLREKWALIPEDLDVLITHGPPMGIGDQVVAEHVGCADLLEAVKLKKPKVHIFGHIHGGYGVMDQWGIKFINASNCTERYKATNKPIVVDLDP